MLKAKKKKRLWPLWLMSILFFIGVASILYPFVGNLVTVMTANTVIADYDNDVKNLSDSDLDELFKKAEQYNTALFKGTPEDGDAKCLNRTDNIICYLDIPSISVYLPVYYGTTDDVLQKGCGYLENTSLPVGGENTHSVIAGHTGLPSAEMLTDLDRVKKGDMFYIHVLDRILAYKIDNIETVNPDSSDALRIVSGEDYVTLLTCTPYGINDRRLLVRGTRVPYTPNTADDDDTVQPPITQEELDWGVIWQIIIISAIAFVALVVFIAAALIVRFNIKKMKRADESRSVDEKREE